MSYRGLKLTAAAAIAVSVAACAADPKETEATSYLDVEVNEAIAKAAERAAGAQETLARVQIARTKPAPLPLDDTDLPEELKRPATIDWSGPAHEAARRVAALIGYRFSIVGNPPSIPPMVHVSMKDASAGKALEQIGLQSFPFGEVAVDPNARHVEYRYLQAHQQPRSVRGTSPALRSVSK